MKITLTELRKKIAYQKQKIRAKEKKCKKESDTTVSTTASSTGAADDMEDSTTNNSVSSMKSSKSKKIVTTDVAKDNGYSNDKKENNIESKNKIIYGGVAPDGGPIENCLYEAQPEYNFEMFVLTSSPTN